jgi:hypothetical protein
MLTTVMWFRRLVADLSSPQTRFEPGPIHVRISCGPSDSATGFSPSVLVFPCQYHSTGPPLAGEVTVRTGFLRVCWFFPCQYHSTSSPYFYSSSELLVTEQQTSNAWGPSNKLMLIGKSVSIKEEKYFHCEYFKWIFV